MKKKTKKYLDWLLAPFYVVDEKGQFKEIPMGETKLSKKQIKDFVKKLDKQLKTKH